MTFQGLACYKRLPTNPSIHNRLSSISKVFPKPSPSLNMPVPYHYKMCAPRSTHATRTLSDTPPFEVQLSTILSIPSASASSPQVDEKSIRSLALDRKAAQKSSDRRKTKPSHKDRSNQTKELGIGFGGRLPSNQLLKQAIWVEEDRERRLRFKDDASCDVCEKMNSEEDRRYLADKELDGSSLSVAHEVPLVHILRPGKSRRESGLCHLDPC